MTRGYFSYNLLYNYRQVHARVNTTVQVESTSGVEWSDHLALASGGELHIAYRWRAGFCHRFGRSINPGTIANDMCHRAIIDQVDAIALADGDRRLREVCVAHMDVGASATRTAARYNQNCHQSQHYETSYKLFHGICFSLVLVKSVTEQTHFLWRLLFGIRGYIDNTAVSLFIFYSYYRARKLAEAYVPSLPGSLLLEILLGAQIGKGVYRITSDTSAKSATI